RRGCWCRLDGDGPAQAVVVWPVVGSEGVALGCRDRRLRVGPVERLALAPPGLPRRRRVVRGVRPHVRVELGDAPPPVREPGALRRGGAVVVGHGPILAPRHPCENAPSTTEGGAARWRTWLRSGSLADRASTRSWTTSARRRST